MSDTHSDALVFFGATGDLAYKKIFPVAAGDDQARPPRRAGHRRRQGRLDARPVQGARTRQPRKHGGVDAGGVRQALPACCATSTATTTIRRRSQAIRKELGGAQRPAHYLAIPPVLFATVVEQLATSGCTARRARDRREAVRPRPRLGAARSTASCLPRSTRRTSSASTTTSASGRCTTWCSSASPTRSSSRSGTASSSKSVQITMAESFGIQGRGAFYDQTGTIRDVIQNHLFQVLANLAMEPPARTDSESIRDEKVKVLKSIPPLARRRPRPRPVPRLPEGAGRRAGFDRSRPSRRCGWRSTRGAGRACRSTSAPASRCR